MCCVGEVPPLLEVENVTDIDHTVDFLPRSKIKASKDAIPTSEVMKLLRHRDHGGQSTEYVSLCENIFTMLSCLVANRVITSGETLNEEEKLALYRTYYYEQMQVCSLDSYLQENLFDNVTDIFQRNAEGELEWPPFYVNFVQQTYASRKLTGVQINRSRPLSKLSEAEGMRYNFSIAIKTAAAEAKTEINNRLSRLWRDPLDSGETPSGLFDVIRETARRRDAYIRAKQSVNANVKKWPVKSRHGKEYEEAIVSKTDKFLSEMSSDYFPSYWLTFALYASPAPNNIQLAIFKVANITDLQKKIVAAEDGTRLGRHSRATLKRSAETVGDRRPPRMPRHRANASPSSGGYTSDDGTAMTSSSGRRERALQVNHVFDMTGFREATQPVVDTSLRGQLSAAIAVLQGAGKNADGTFVFQERITQLSARLCDLMMAQIDSESGTAEKDIMETE